MAERAVNAGGADEMNSSTNPSTQSTLEKVAAKDQMATVRRRARTTAWPMGVCVLLTIFLAGDLAADFDDGVSMTHMAFEFGAVVVALVGIVITGRQLACAVRKASELQRDLVGARVQLERSRSEAEALVRRLGRAIEAHFGSWALTGAEREIALLILKGLSYKEIASERGTTERTVRHQALAIYRKAGVTGRAEMAAFFLQDMLHRAACAPTTPVPETAAAENVADGPGPAAAPEPARAPLGALSLVSSRRGP